MQAFIDKQFFNLTVFTLIFGVMFYDIIDLMGFAYVDEICAVLLLLLFLYKAFSSRTWEFDRTFLIITGVFIFYLIYSIVIGSNSTGAILTDFIIQIKPYLAFACVYALHPNLTDNQKRIIKQIILLCSLYVFVIGVIGIVSYSIIEYTFSHYSRLATASSILALLYLYCSDYTKVDKFIFVIILALGILSGRSKHFGFFAFSLLAIFYFNESFKMKLNFRNTIFITAAIAFTVFVAWEKIYFYFVTGGFGGGREVNDLYARMALYYFSSQILMDYIPFGCGFASYGTYASASSYSQVYVKYGMDGMYGLSKSAPDFVADTYYPVLAQFGFAGVALFLFFWVNLSRKAVKAYLKGFYKEAVIAIMIVVFFIIECTSDATLTHNRGMFMRMILGLVFSDVKIKGTNEGIVSK